jgi:hypothetical protein
MGLIRGQDFRMPLRWMMGVIYLGLRRDACLVRGPSRHAARPCEDRANWNTQRPRPTTETQTSPRDGDGKPIPGEPYWVTLSDITDEDVLPHGFWEAVDDAIEVKCKVEDAERRTAAKAKLTPRSRKRH